MGPIAYLREASAKVARPTNRAMREPQTVERVTGTDSHAFFFIITHWIVSLPNEKNYAMKTFGLLSKGRNLFILIFLLSAFIDPNQAKGEPVNFQFQIGGMYLKQYGAGGYLEEKANSYELKGAFLLQIPLTNKIPIFLETGVDFRYKYILSQSDGYKFNAKEPEKGVSYFGHKSILELPLKVGYKIKLNEKNAIDFGLGPYYGTDVSASNYLGLNASVAFRHRCMSFGIEWQNPLFINQNRNYYKNSIMVTIGINFKGRKVNMDGLLEGLEIASGVLNSANDALQSYYNPGENYNSINYDTYSSNSTNYQTMYDKWEKRAQEAYSSLAGHSGSASTYSRNKKLLREAQKEMRSWRNKALKAGITIQKSYLEDVNVNIK